MGLFDYLLRTGQAQSSDLAGYGTTPEPGPVQQDAPLLKLPSEVIYQILTHLDCPALVTIGRTCRLLHTAALTDLLWSDLLRRQIPSIDFPDSGPFPSSSYRDLYITHHPYWFVPKYKIWFSNDPHVGRMIVCRFDPRRGCIEGYRLLAERGSSEGMLWPYNRSVVIHKFEPKVHLWLDEPVLTLAHDVGPFSTKQGWWEGEIKVNSDQPRHHAYSSFFLSRNVQDDPRMDVWPPRTIPGMPRVRAASLDRFRGRGHKPQRYDEISETTFRMRHWSQFSAGLLQYGVRIGEEVSTWSTLDPSLYIPTPQKPYQGIYVGDYAGHGCEFLLVMHTDHAPPPPPAKHTGLFAQGLVDLEDMEAPDGLHPQAVHTPEESSTHYTPPLPFPSDAAARDDDSVFRGALEAVKLTGDPNVPRGEHTFIADDIGPNGLVRIATERPFMGARVVRSRGHVAARGFMHDEFIPSQLIMINHNRIAQYWVPFGHISFYQRVDIDQLVDGIFHNSTNVPKPESSARLDPSTDSWNFP